MQLTKNRVKSGLTFILNYYTLRGETPLQDGRISMLLSHAQDTGMQTLNYLVQRFLEFLAEFVLHIHRIRVTISSSFLRGSLSRKPRNSVLRMDKNLGSITHNYQLHIYLSNSDSPGYQQPV